MKKNVLLGICMSLTVMVFSQVTDENGVSATGAFNQVLTGKIGIGLSNPSEQLDVSETIKGRKGLFDNRLPDGTTFSNTADNNFRSRVLGVGRENATNSFTLNVFDFPKSNINAQSMLLIGMNDRNDMTRWRYYASTGGGSTLRYYNKYQSEVFKLNEDGNDNVSLNLNKTNSRIVIGSYGTYLPAHKFVVRNGSAMIEGNILTNSKIGIGTSSFTDGADTYHLSVNGKVRAHGVKVYTDWADYVFEDDYKLPTLEEVEQHIKDKGHLKDIPSAAEVEEQGIELGEMNKLLLQKIEELTLYTIQLKKEIDEIKAENHGND